MVAEARDEDVTEPTTSASQHEAPPEKASTARLRRPIIVSFWLVVLCLGLPHWIWTTSIRRAELPLESMRNWAEGNACQLHYPLNIQLVSQALDASALATLAGQVQSQSHSSAEWNNSHPVIASHVNGDTTNASPQPALVVDLQGGSHEQRAVAFKSWEPVLEIVHPVDDLPALSSYIAQQLRDLFRHEQLSASRALAGTAFGTRRNEGSHHGGQVLDSAERTELEARTTRAFKYASTYHLTFSLFTAGASPSSWDIEQALHQYISPLLRAFSTISNITVETQVQLHAALAPSIVGPLYNSANGRWELQKNDLSGFINAAEWPLSPSIGSGPTINFVLYVPAVEKSPLTIAETGGTSWLVPQWGGVQIINAPNPQMRTLTMDDLRPVMLTFADQLTSLLGLPRTPSSISLRIASLTRERTVSLVLSASSTLGALARLTEKLTSISIPDSVSEAVSKAIHHLGGACSSMCDGQFERALHHARSAEAEAESAFFEPSMVGQVYFPDEHKVAVYVPLLGPMVVPLILAAIKELRSLRRPKSKTA